MNPEVWYRERLNASLTASDKRTIESHYEMVTGKSFAGSFSQNCPNKYKDAITHILIKMKQDNTDNGGYVLKQGAFRYKGKVITNANMTAEAAEWWIHQNLDNRDQFASLGKDYDSYATTSVMMPAKE